MADPDNTKPAAKTGPKLPETGKGHFVLIKTTNRLPRRRAGLRITPEGVRVDVSTLSKTQAKAIEADPVLKISEIKE